MIQNKYLNFFFSLLIIIFLLAVFFLFCLNIATRKLGVGSAYDFLKQVFMKSEEFQPSNFGHQIGSEINDSSYGGEVMQATPSFFQENGQNYINVGPDIFLFSGRYRLTYDVAVTGVKDGVNFAIIDVFQLGRGVAIDKTLNSSVYSQASYKKEEIEFQTEGGRNFEFRVLYLGEGELKIGKAKIEMQGKNYGLFLKKSFKTIVNKTKQILQR